MNVDVGLIALLTVAFGFLLLLIQRTERKRRLVVFLMTLVALELLRRYVWYRDVHTEAWIALVLAIILNVLFWLFIGRYNPPGSSDDIKVYKMDD